MPARQLTRREFAVEAARWTSGALGAGAAASLGGCGPKAGQRRAASGAPPSSAAAEDAAPAAGSPPNALPSRVIDVHIHANFADPVRIERIEADTGIEYSPQALHTEMAAVGVEQALSLGQETEIGFLSHTADNPMGLAEAAARSPLLTSVHLVGGINAHRLDAANLGRIEQALATGSLKGLKLYLGYYHFAPDDPVYRPLYPLAERYGVPVIFHTGDTLSTRAKVRFAHPLVIDDLAVDYPGVKFVLAHLGNPWTIDAAEVLYKNPNVYADLSGFLVGNAAYFTDPQNQEGIDHAVQRIREAFAWVEDPGKFLYGSDWPLAPMKPYLEFVARAIDAQDHERVFFENAKQVFGLA